MIYRVIGYSSGEFSYFNWTAYNRWRICSSINYRYLLNSGILFRFYESVRLKISYSKKENNLEAVKINREIVKLPNRKNELEFEKEFQKDSIKLNKMDKKQ